MAGRDWCRRRRPPAPRFCDPRHQPRHDRAIPGCWQSRTRWRPSLCSAALTSPPTPGRGVACAARLTGGGARRRRSAQNGPMASVAFVINRGLVRDRRAFMRRCLALAEAEGFKATFAETGSAQEGLRAVREAVAAGARLVFAVGGDGTVRTCAQALEGTGVPLAIVPLGTANLVARALSVPDRIGPALRVGFRGRDRLIDLACVEDPGGGVFVAMAGIGLDAAVVRAARGGGKRRLGWVAYLAAGARHLGWGEREFSVRLDDETVVCRRARCVGGGDVGVVAGGV